MFLLSSGDLEDSSCHLNPPSYLNEYNVGEMNDCMPTPSPPIEARTLPPDPYADYYNYAI